MQLFFTTSQDVSNLCVEFRIKEIIVGIGYTERMLSEKSLGSRSLVGISGRDCQRLNQEIS